MIGKLSPANTVILAGGAVMLIGSFLTFYSYSGLTFSAWSGGSNIGVFGIATTVVLCGMVMGGQVAIVAFAEAIKVPEKVLGLTWDQIHLTLGFQAALMMLAFLLRAKGSYRFGTGFWLMLFAGIALFAGAILRVTGAGTKPS